MDKKPSGLWSELQPTLTYLQHHAPDTRLVLLLRDILDTPEVTIAQWQRENYYALAEARYDQVWIVGTPDIFDAPRAYEFPASLAAKSRFMGYVRRGEGLRHPAEVRRSLGIAKSDRFVLVTPGGGGDGFRLVDTYLQALETPGCQPTVSLIVGGPEMPTPQKQTLLARIAQTPGLRWLEFTDDLASYMAAADAVVSMGGYNTVGEILSLQRRAVVVPRTQPVAEQWIRAQRLAELGLLTVIHPDVLTPARLAQAVQAELQRDSSPLGYQLDLNALPRITEALLALFRGAQLQPQPGLVA